jgi:chorismate mutase
VTPPELESLRQAIDAVDQKILELVSERIRLVMQVGDFKRERNLPVYDADRERTMLERLASQATPPLDGTTVRRVFERIIDEARRIEQHHMSK